MSKAEVCRDLYVAAEFHLFGPGSWPAEPEAAAAFWELLKDLRLTTNVPDEPGRTEYTPLGLELNVELVSIFAGAVKNLWDIPLLLDLMGYMDDEEADEIYASASRDPEHVIHQHVLQVYYKFCRSSKCLN